MTDEERLAEGVVRVGPSEESRQRLLRLITKSFCRELIDYGVGVRDLLKVSSHILEFASYQTDHPQPGAESAFRRFGLKDIRADGDSYRMGTTVLRPFSADHLGLIAKWVAQDEIRNSMLVAFPAEEDELRAHMESPDRTYHMILRNGEPSGLIGAEEIDRNSQRVEMRKFIGEKDMRGRGLGTEATFLWLHHAFDVLEFNKVYIHTQYANARNIRVNRSLGFELEGVLSEERLLGGCFVDVIRMGLLRRTWNSLTH